ncbi:MAG: hypothetical protein NZ898_06075 [Myxococcota bacterium]|nr:hypothetical protein [Myxococcota bacterium]MDW8362179.1 hypothetical protein [Myxococcales bacterium]
MDLAVRASWIVGLSWLVVSACRPQLPEGRFRCETAGDCPRGWACVEQRCWSIHPGPRDAAADGRPDGDRDAERMDADDDRDAGRRDAADDGGVDGGVEAGSIDATHADDASVPPDGTSADITGPEMDASDGNVPTPDAAEASAPDAGCVPATCASLGVECGRWDDGCGASAECGTCDAGAACDSGGRCRCVPDAAEDDDTPETARAVDVAGGATTFVDRTIDARADHDWLAFVPERVVTRASVTLDPVAEGADYDLVVGFSCPGGVGAAARCAVGEEVAGPFDFGCASMQRGEAVERVLVDAPCAGRTPPRVLVGVVVHTHAACTPYRLVIDVAG